MPVYNGQDFLAEAVDSVLRQTYTDFEFIILDDGSTDGTADILRSRMNSDQRILVIRREHCGITNILNEGLRAARGEFIARMDSDDISMPHRFAVQIEFLMNNPSVVAVGCAVEIIDSEGDTLGIMNWPGDHELIDRLLLRGKAGLPHPGAMIRRQAMIAVGGYREKFAVAQDKDLWLRLAEVGRLANLDNVLLMYRQHLRSISSLRLQEQHAAVVMALKDAYQRRGLDMPDSRALPVLAAVLTPTQMRRQWMRQAFRSGNFTTAFKHLRRHIAERPYSLARWLGAVGYGVSALRSIHRVRSRTL